jgi:hypothetical protein
MNSGTTPQACQVVFQDASNAWSAGCATVVSNSYRNGGLFYSTFSNPSWVSVSFGLPGNETALRSIVGKPVNGVFMLYVTGDSSYTTTSTNLWSFNSLTHAWSAQPILSSPFGAIWKGVALAPYSVLLNPTTSASASATPPMTPSNTQTPLPCAAAIQLPSSTTGQVINSTSTASYAIIPGGAVCNVGAIQTGQNSAQQYYAWQSPVATGNLVVTTCSQSTASTSFDTKLFVLNQCPGVGATPSGSSWAQCVGSNDDTLCGGAPAKQSTVSLVTSPGQMYFIMVTGKPRRLRLTLMS